MPATVVLNDITHQFTDALQRLENEGDVDGLVALFAPDAVIETPSLLHPAQGEGEVRDFWRRYVGGFQSVTTEFTLAIRDGDDVCLEWRSHVVPHGDHAPFDYLGVTLLRLDNEKVRHMRSYFDTARFPSLQCPGRG